MLSHVCSIGWRCHMSAQLARLFFFVLFICHLIGCAAYYIATIAQPEHVYGMFRQPQWWASLEQTPLALMTFRYILIR